MDRALEGMLVLDLTQFEAGTTCTQMLGWLGANVIKFEPPKRGEQGRRLAPANGNGKPVDSWYFLMFSSNKRSVTLDLKSPKGRELFLKMVPKADVVAENQAPGTLERLGLGYDVLKELNPGIILVRVKGFGVSGPYAHFKSFDPVGQAAGGIMSVTGDPDRPPTRAGAAIADTGTGMLAAAGVMAAYIQRQRTGKGQVVECSMQESIINLARGRYQEYYSSEPHVAPSRNRDSLARTRAPAGLYPCKGGGPNDYVFLSMSPAGPGTWDAFLRTIGREDLIGDERYATDAARVQHREFVDKLVTDYTTVRTKREVMEALGNAGVPCSATMDMADLLEDPHLAARHAFDTIEHPDRGTFRLPACPIRLSASATPTRRPPLLGEHTEEVLNELLGMSAAEVEDLRAQGIV